MKRQRPNRKPAGSGGSAQGAARRQRFSLGGRLRHLARLHSQVLISSLGRLFASPVGNLMTAAVIAIALALPSGLLTLLDNLQRLSLGWEGSASISLFLNSTISDEQATKIAENLRNWSEISEITVLSRAAALADFRVHSGFGDALDNLDENPLPAVLIIQPTDAFSDAHAAQSLLNKLSALPETDLAQLDLQWVKRFNALMNIGRRAIWVVGSLLGIAVLLIVGNTIRLDIQNRRDEIEVIKLIGGTDAFIRRPFLYTGLWYGLIGAFVAILLVHIGFFILSGPAAQLAGLYQSSFRIASISAGNTGFLFLLAGLLGWGGSWLAVGQHLRHIEPR